jgi:broad specificity phosphatase PhoE
MSVLLLVRHGQASWGSADYDQLSDDGVEQSRVLGRHLAGLGITPARVWTGGMRRHDQTLAAAAEAAGWQLRPQLDRGWAEFDHVEILRRFEQVRRQRGGGMDDHEPGDWDSYFDAAVDRWTRGDHDHDYAESFDQFTTRVGDGLRRAVDTLRAGETGVVFTSGGAIAWVTAAMWHMGVEQWSRINPVLVNAGVTKLVTGSRGVNLVSLNEHAHLPRPLVTYR